MADEPEDDIAGDISAAIKEAGGGEAATPAALAAPQANESPASGEPVAQARDDGGKFTAKPGADAPTAATAETNTDQPAASATEVPQEPIRAPTSWSAVGKSKFATLDPEVQSEISKRERDVDRILSERGAQLKAFEPLEKAIAPERGYLRMNGVDDATYITSLIAADKELRGPNPAQALAQIARVYGINIGQPPASAGQTPQASQLPPYVQQMAERMAFLEQTVTQQQSQAQAAEAAQSQASIDAFAQENLYFENVKPEMVALLKAGVVDNLPDAYRKACWARDDIRPLLMKEEEANRTAAVTEAARAKATAARQASGSITGSPAPGATAATPANANSSIEDDVRAAFAAHS